jgi:AmmeMemoRadiSam system protein A
MSISCAVLMCHAPIVVPSIGGLRESNCASTTRAMREAARALVAHEPQLIVLVSPHAPRHERSFGLIGGRELHGSFARFGCPEVDLRFHGSSVAVDAITQAARGYGLSTRDVPGDALDHGTLVPLFFVHEAGYRGPVVVVAPPFPGLQTEVLFGEVLREAARSLNERWAVLASGDMSHRLTLDAPLGFDPRAMYFDETFVEYVRAGDLRGAIGIDPGLADTAAEDVIQSTAVAAGAIAFRARGRKVFSYESPFGVGYLEAMLYSDRAEIRHRAPPTELIDIARRAIECELRGENYLPPHLDAPWHDPRAVFVTLRDARGELRGCIGRTEPIHASLIDEVVDCATAAATRDYRMQPVELEELAGLTIDVSVLDDPEPVEDRNELDPKRYGIVVTRGLRRGVMLPEMDGIDTPADQLRVALQKGGISPTEPYRVERFSVSKVAARPSVVN